mgnify:CR=1 FL=1
MDALEKILGTPALLALIVVSLWFLVYYAENDKPLSFKLMFYTYLTTLGVLYYRGACFTGEKFIGSRLTEAGMAGGGVKSSGRVGRKIRKLLDMSNI